MYVHTKVVTILVFIASITGCFTNTKPDNNPDISFADTLWNVMQKGRLVGNDMIKTTPFYGGAKPHGTYLEILTDTIVVDGKSGFLVLKRNYDGTGVNLESVKNDRNQFLKSITIMYQREEGYDSDNLNWFWAKYYPDGRLYQIEYDNNMLLLAGRLIKDEETGQNNGCLYCHASAGGGDYIFYPDIILPNFSYGEVRQ